MKERKIRRKVISLKKYYGEKVSILASNNKTYKGVVSYYFPHEENENNKESIVITNPYREFYVKDIKEIKIIK